MWQRAKAKFKSMFGTTNRDMVPDYLGGFMWNQRFKEHSYTAVPCMNSMVKKGFFKSHKQLKHVFWMIDI